MESRIEQINERAISQCRSIDAVIAYVTDQTTLLDCCLKADKPLEIWVRYDYSVPVSLDILKDFLTKRSPNYVCHLVAGSYHPKVIWWREYGVYIGSANLSDSAWFKNIEAGIFLTEEELHENEIFSDLEDFFEYLDRRSHPLTEEIYKQLSDWSNDENFKALWQAQKEFEKVRKLPKLKGISDVTKEKSQTKKKNKFLSEWNSTLQQLRDIARRVSSDTYRPSWVPEGTFAGTQADQFLHAYYYEQVQNQYKTFHRHNKDNPEKALVSAMEWLREWPEPKPPKMELLAMTDWSVYLQQKLTRENIISLSEDDFVEVCKRVHAIREHSLRVSHESLGLKEKLPKMEADQRYEFFSRWLYKQRSKNGDTVLECLHFVLYGGQSDKTPDRLFEACFNPKRQISHLGVSSIGEIIGWTLPDKFPPRNGQTSKALTALGYPVKIHSGNNK